MGLGKGKPSRAAGCSWRVGVSSGKHDYWQVGFFLLARDGHEWKKMPSKKGAGYGDAMTYHVQKTFLKRVVLARYRGRVLAQS